MPARSLTAQTTRQIARPLKVLIPLIQSQLQQGDTAGREHYRRAGEMLEEAKAQVGHGNWGRWLKKNFELSQWTAGLYMRWARVHNEGGAFKTPPASMRELSGHTARDREQRAADREWEKRPKFQFERTLRDVNADLFAQERQARDDEVKLHRDLAEELIDLGFRALATKLHPDRGGSKDAMARLNRVRDELKTVAQTRRFV